MATPTTTPQDPNQSSISGAGLVIESKANIIAFLNSQYQAIYGNDINLQSNSPDGQLVNIQAQAIADFNELLLDTYNSFAINSAYGQRLDQLVALNGIQRLQGTQTQAQVLVTATLALTLPGLDQTAVPAFTVADNAGNQYQLLTSHVFGGAGLATLTFQAVTIGQIFTTPNTITNIVTSTLGISTVNNPSTASDLIGVNEESDAQLRIRHNQSLALASTGPSDAMEAALRNIPGIVDAYVVENNTGSIVNGIPANSVWPIVNGVNSSPLAVAVATAIYSKKSAGCGLKGVQAWNLARPNGQTFTAQWDTALSQPLYIAFAVIWIGPQALSYANIETLLASALSYKLGQNPSIGDILIAMQTIAPTAVVTINPAANQGVSSDDATWLSVVQPTTPQYYFQVLAANITVT